MHLSSLVPSPPFIRLGWPTAGPGWPLAAAASAMASAGPNLHVGDAEAKLLTEWRMCRRFTRARVELAGPWPLGHNPRSVVQIPPIDGSLD